MTRELAWYTDGSAYVAAIAARVPVAVMTAIITLCPRIMRQSRYNSMVVLDDGAGARRYAGACFDIVLIQRPDARGSRQTRYAIHDVNLPAAAAHRFTFDTIFSVFRPVDVHVR